jgi:hypothetical protein
MLTARIIALYLRSVSEENDAPLSFHQRVGEYGHSKARTY